MCKYLLRVSDNLLKCIIALDTADIITITLGLASLGATIAGNIIAYHSLKALTLESKHIDMLLLLNNMC
jgi:hypothetical protein